MQSANDNELKAAMAMVDEGTAGGADYARLEEEAGASTEDFKAKGGRKASPSKSRESRLQQNRKAARDSRKRKKEMIEELQRSLIFFSRSNAALKQQNDYLTRRLIEAQTTIQTLQKQNPSQEQGSQEQAMTPAPQATTQPVTPSPQVVYQAAPTAGVFVSSNEGPPVPASPLDYFNAFAPAMQPGSTMQAMANFQQAAAVAMQAAAQGMHRQAAQQITHLAEEGPPMETPTKEEKIGNTSQAPPQDSNNVAFL